MIVNVKRERMRSLVLGRKLRTLSWLALVTAVAVGIAVWQLPGGSSARASLRSVPVGRGDIVLTVGGVGKIVAGGAPAGTAAAPAGSPGGAAATGAAGSQSGPSLAGAGRMVFPQVAGHVVAVLVAPGRHVSAGQALARLDPTVARSNLVAARATLDQAVAQLRIDSTGVTPQSLASARAGVATARAAEGAARQALAHAIRVNRDVIRATQLQVAQARTGASGATTAGGNATTASARTAVAAARDAVAAATEALADVRAANGKQAATLQHNLDAAGRDLAGDQERLQRDLKTERSFCGTTSPTIGTDTAPECAAAANTVSSDEQAIVKDQAAVQAAQDAIAQGVLGFRQSEHQAAAQVAAAANALRIARAQLTALGAMSRQGLATARSVLAQARSKAAESESQARMQVRAARVGVANANQALAALHQGAPAPLLAQDRSKIVAARAQLAAARAAVEQTIVRSPAAGTVTWVFVQPGASADLATPVAAVADLAHLAVSVDLSEFDAARVHEGMRAVVSIDALGGRKLPGRVEFEALTGLDNAGVVTFPVGVELKRAAGSRPGMNVSVRIIVAERRNVLRVPLEAVTRDGGAARATVVDSAGHRSTRAVQLGLSDNKSVEVRRGLRGGERVLLASGEGV